MRNCVMIIPAYKPDEHLLKTIESVKEAGFQDIIVVDDGSGEQYRPYFENAKKAGAIVLTHAVNMGKGRAMKTAFNYVLNEYDKGAIVIDSDGQHPASFAIHVDEQVVRHPDKLVLACRQFTKAKVPTANLIGNTLTRGVFFLLTGNGYADTQCGLRGYPRDVMKQIISGAGERYEYENEMLLIGRKKGIGTVELPMDAVYLGENQVSHFNHLTDSIRIYKIILRFALHPFLCGLLSILLFFILRVAFLNVLIPAGIAFLTGYVIMFLDEKKFRWLLFAILFTAVAVGMMYVLQLAGITDIAAYFLASIPSAALAYSTWVVHKYGKRPERVKIK